MRLYDCLSSDICPAEDTGVPSLSDTEAQALSRCFALCMCVCMSEMWLGPQLGSCPPILRDGALLGWREDTPPHTHHHYQGLHGEIVKEGRKFLWARSGLAVHVAVHHEVVLWLCLEGSPNTGAGAEPDTYGPLNFI